jgi:hypothetical protein
VSKPITLGRIGTVGALKRALQGNRLKDLSLGEYEEFLRILSEMDAEDSLCLRPGPPANGFWSDVQIQLEAYIETLGPFILSGVSTAYNRKTQTRLRRVKRLLAYIRRFLQHRRLACARALRKSEKDK